MHSIVLFTLLISFCLGRIYSVSELSDAGNTRPMPKNAIWVPEYKQRTDYSCGPSSTLSVLLYWEFAKYQNYTEYDLYPLMGTTEANGTSAERMAKFFGDTTDLGATYFHGSTVKASMLQSIIDRRYTAIVELQAWKSNASLSYENDWSDGHYNVLVGYDNEAFFFMDPWIGKYAWIGKQEWLTRWHDTDSGVNAAKRYNQVIILKGKEARSSPPKKLAEYEA